MRQGSDIPPTELLEETPEEELRRLRIRNRTIYRKRMLVVACALLIAASYHWRRNIALWTVGQWNTIRGGGHQISAAAAMQRVFDKDAIIVDVRDPAEFAVSHAVGARSLPLETLTKDGWPRDWPSDRPIIVYCTVGYRSGKAAEILSKSGLSAENLAGGILALAEADEALVDDRGRTLRVHTWSKDYAWMLPPHYEAIWTENQGR